MPKLPARDLSAVQLGEMFAGPGCPLCRQRDIALTRYIEGFMYESVSDVAFRRSLDEARGFCPPHTDAVLLGGRHVTGGMLGSAILFGAIMRIREQELRAVHGGGRLSRGRRARAAARPPACLVCAEAQTVDLTAVNRLVRLAEEPGWAAAIGEAAFCLDHLATLMAAPDRAASWSAIEDRQLERIGALRTLVEDYAHNASHDRRHLTTAEQTAAPTQAAEFLGGRRVDRDRTTS